MKRGDKKERRREEPRRGERMAVGGKAYLYISR
jgi:hypothetical protein